MFLPPGKGKNWGWKNFYLEVKLLVHTLLTSHHTSNSDHLRARNQLFRHFNPKRGILGVFLPPGRGENWEAKKILLEKQTKCPYASNKLSYIKFGPFWGALSTFLTFFFLTKRGCFYPLEGAKNGGRKIFFSKVKLLAHTLLTSHHASKSDHFWARYQLFWHSDGPTDRWSDL